MRIFEGGAMRDNLNDKLSYMRALSPAVLRRYVQYLAKHRQTSNGFRDFDNWKKGIDQSTYCDSMLRHIWDAWLTSFGYEPSDQNYELQELLCAIIFNAQGWLFELIHNKTRENTVECQPITDPARLLPAPRRTCGQCVNGGSIRCPKLDFICEYDDGRSFECFVPKVPI